MNEKRKARLTERTVQTLTNAAANGLGGNPDDPQNQPCCRYSKFFMVEAQLDPKEGDCFAVYRVADLLTTVGEDGLGPTPEPVHVFFTPVDAATAVLILDEMVLRISPDEPQVPTAAQMVQATQIPAGDIQPQPTDPVTQ